MLGILPAAIMALTLTGYLINAQLENLNQAFNERGKAIADQSASLSIYGIFTGDMEILGNALQVVLEQSDVVSVTVTDAKGAVLSHLEHADSLHSPVPETNGIRSFTTPVFRCLRQERLLTTRTRLATQYKRGNRACRSAPSR